MPKKFRLRRVSRAAQRGFLLMNPFWFGSNDPYFSNVSLLMHGDVDPDYASVSLAMRMDGTNGSTTFTDNSPSPKSLTAAGTAQISTAQSKFGGASGKFDTSTANKVTAPASVDFVLGGGGSFTVEFWLYPTAFNASVANVLGADGGFNGFNSTTGIHWYIFLDASALYFKYWDGSASAQVLIAAPILNTWNHIALSFDGANFRGFRDGVLRFTTPRTLGAAPTTTPTFAIGTYPSGPVGTTNTYSGHLDDIRITKGVARYTTNFAPIQIPATSGSTLFIDNSPSPKTVTANGNAQISTAQSKFGGASMSFDGTGDYATTVGVELGSGDFTIEGWFYSQSAANKGLFTLYTGVPTAGGGVAVGYDSTRFVTYSLGGQGMATSTTITLNTWFHIALICTGLTVTLYLNGVSIGSGTATIAQDYSTYTTLTLGAYYSTSFCWQGYIDDFRVTKGVARYTANFTPPTAPFPNA